MKQVWLALFVALFTLPSFAIVDMRNANYSDTWTDIETGSAGFDLKVKRTYNSRTVHNGIFGFGWCSDYETKIKVTAQNTLRLTECGAGLNIEYSRGKAKSEKSVNSLIKDIMAEVKKRNKGQPKSFFSNLERQMRTDELLRDEFAKQLNMTGKIAKGKKYFAEGRGNEWVTREGNNFVRRIPSGTIQKFNSKGDLIEIKDTSNNFLKLSYNGKKIAKIVNSSGSSLQFKYAKGSRYVASIVGPNNTKATYKYKGENLVSVKNAWKNTYGYQYDDLHNMTRINYPDKTFIKVTYNKDKDWVTSFRNRKGCVETYKYGQAKKDPLNNYSSRVVKKCNGKITNKSSYEFWHKIRKDGSRYLAQSESVVNGKKATTKYHPEHGRPIEIAKQGTKVRYSYYKNGLLKTKNQPGQEIRYKYSGTCQKPSEVESRYAVKRLAKGKRKPSTITKVVKTNFKYNRKNCLLTSAKNSEGQSAAVKYDRKGKIRQIVDQSKKIVNITYDDRFGKPKVVERPGLGKIKFIYKSNGDLDKIDSDDEPLVAVQVANMFSNLLEIIGPGTTETPI